MPLDADKIRPEPAVSGIGIILSARAPSKVPARLRPPRRRIRGHWPRLRRAAQREGFLLGACPIQSRSGDNSTILPAAIVDSAQRGEILHVPQVIIASDLEDIDLVPALELCSLGA